MIKQQVDEQAEKCCWQQEHGYYVEGDGFMQLWELVKPFVRKSVGKFCSDFSSTKLPFYADDIEAEVREKMYMHLRKCGPHNEGYDFHQTLSTIQFEVFSRLFREILRIDKTKLNYTTVSTDMILARGENNSTGILSSRVEQMYDFRIDISMHIPVRFRRIIEQLYGGETLHNIAKERGTPTRTLRRQLQKYFPK